MFDINSITDDQVNAHCDLVWSDSDYGADTPNYFKTFSPLPTNNNELDAMRNQTKIRHVMLGNKLWNSFTSNFQLEILPQSGKFKSEGEFNGVQLLHHFRKHVNPSTTVGSSRLKDEIESKDLK